MARTRKQNDAGDSPDENLPRWLRNRKREQEAWYGLVEATVTREVEVKGVPMKATQTSLRLGLGISHPTLLKYQRAPEFGPAVLATMKTHALLDDVRRARMELETAEKLEEMLHNCDPIKDLDKLLEIDRQVTKRPRGRPRKDDDYYG